MKDNAWFWPLISLVGLVLLTLGGVVIALMVTI